MITAADDSFHPAASPDPLWTETTWWGFQVPERKLGGMIYTLFRPNLGVASLVVQVWDDEHIEPWLAPYARTLWHVPHPDADLTDCQVAGLRIQAHEPLTSYRLSYEDGDLLRLDLHYRALMEPFAVVPRVGSGHFDQAMHVSGSLQLGDTSIEVDCPAVRDRSWYVRDDLRSMRAGYTYGIVDEDEHFLAHSRFLGAGEDETAIVGGYLVRDGTQADLVSGVRRVVERRRGHPEVIELTAVDRDGRELHATGTTTCSLASQSTPGMFAWMTMSEWAIAGRTGRGEDHDVWSPDHLVNAR